MRIGAVADDVTGATDLCLILSRAGLRTVQVMELPPGGTLAGDVALQGADAVVIALKSRTIPATAAVEQSVAAARALTAAGAEQLMFKYCSTFDSTDAGNIGPVAEALLAFSGGGMTIACPAFPANGRTVYQGHLFVGDRLLSDSPMKDHPLTPMRDADLVRVLARQTRGPVGLVDAHVVAGGVQAVRSAFAAQMAAGRRIVVVDALNDAHLMTLGAACAGMALVTGGSGIAAALAANFPPGSASGRARMAAPAGRAVSLAGSCSEATRAQIAAARAAGVPVLELDATAVADGRQTVAGIVDWAVRQPETPAPLIASSAGPETLARVQQALGRDRAGALVEDTVAEVAQGLHAAGFSRFVIAGGETAGAVVAALGVQMLEIGPEIDPGVPWTRCIRGPDIVLALKSGNFGAPDFFLRSWVLLEPGAGHV